ncbi:MAG: hypothetical protein P1U56_03175 [Saprospiraceae bacterium]|nr:hypothetical protein [Saprospiraceae bacterium]
MKFKSVICLIFYFILINFSTAQKLTVEEGNALADGLYDIELLSDKGRKELKELININKFERPLTNLIEFGGPKVKRGLSKSQVLIYLRDAFFTDYYHRTGILRRRALMEKFGPINIKGNTTSKEAQKQIKAYHHKIDELMVDFEGFEIEKAIPFEGDSSVLGWTAFPSLLGSKIGDEINRIHSKRSVMGKTKTRTLRDLLALRLINPYVFEKIEKKIHSHKVSEHELLSMAVDETMPFEDVVENQNNVRSYIQHLYQQNVVPKDNLADAMEYNSQTIPIQLFDLVPYFQLGRIFKLEDFDSNAEIGYKQIYESMQLIVPDFKFTEFESKVVYNKDPWGGDFVESKIQIQFKVKDRIYKGETFLNFYPKDSIIEKEPLIVRGDIHVLVNKFLLDEASPYRLFFVKKKKVFDSAIDESEFGLVVLDKNEYDALGKVNTNQYLSREDFDLSFSTMQIEQSIDAFMENGLFAHLTPSEIADGMDCVFSSTIENYPSILSCFENVVTYFDLETGNYKNPYEELTRNFASISRGAFRPERIVDTFSDSWGKNNTKFGFELGNKKYEIQLKSNFDWLDPEFLSLINQARRENNIEGQWYLCSDDGEVRGYIFLNDEQYEFLKENYSDLFLDLNENYKN